MAFFNLSLGIDFKRNQLILTLLRKSFGKIRLVDYRTHVLSPDSPKEMQQPQWISQISAFIAQRAIDKEKVSISIPREKVMIRFIRLPLAAQENLRQVLLYEMPKYIPFDPDEIYFDYQIIRRGEDFLNLVVVFAKKEDIHFYLSHLKKAGIQPWSIQVSSTAALNLFFYGRGDREDEYPVLVDLTEPFCEMNLIQDGEWKESFQLSLPPEEKGEKILNTFRQAGLPEDWVLKSTFFIYGMDVSSEGIPSLGKALPRERISFPPVGRIEDEGGKPVPHALYGSIGLPLKGLTPTRIDLNLLPLEMRKKARKIGKPLFLFFLILSVILSFSWGWGFYHRYQKELNILREEVKKRKPEVEAVEKLRKQREELRDEILELGKIRAGEFSKVEILKELSQVLPPTVWIWSFKQTGKEIEISGFADSASDLIPLLDRSPFFEKVEFLAPVTKERERRMGGDKEKERFKIKMRLEERRKGS
jgi:general secretion pathway protein L